MFMQKQNFLKLQLSQAVFEFSNDLTTFKVAHKLFFCPDFLSKVAEWKVNFLFGFPFYSSQTCFELPTTKEPK